MDSVSGRFQAFEVSTAEELPPPPPAPHASSEPTSLPLAPESAVTPSPIGEPVTEVPLETNSAAFSPCVQDGVRAKNASPVARPPTSAAPTSPVLIHRCSRGLTCLCCPLRSTKRCARARQAKVDRGLPPNAASLDAENRQVAERREETSSRHFLGLSPPVPLHDGPFQLLPPA